MASETVKHLTTDALDQFLKDNAIVIIDFWAQWCGPCRGFAPVFEAAADKHTEIAFAKVNVDEEPDLAGRYGVRQIPTTVVIKNGQVVKTQVGALRGDAFDHFLDDVVNLA